MNEVTPCSRTMSQNREALKRSSSTSRAPVIIAETTEVNFALTWNSGNAV